MVGSNLYRPSERSRRDKGLLENTDGFLKLKKYRPEGARSSLRRFIPFRSYDFVIILLLPVHRRSPRATGNLGARSPPVTQDFQSVYKITGAISPVRPK